MAHVSKPRGGVAGGSSAGGTNAQLSTKKVSFGAVALFAVAIALLVFAGVGGAQAALTYVSEEYGAQFGLQNIGITLVENGEPVSWRDFLGTRDDWDQNSNNPEDPTCGILLDGSAFTESPLMPGRTYDEVLTVRNIRQSVDVTDENGENAIPVYVRVKVQKYWVDDATGAKRTDLDPSLIDLHLLTDGAWVEDTAARTPELSVLYYTPLLDYGTESAPFADALTISKDVVADVQTTVEKSENGYTTYISTYKYNDAHFVIHAEVDAVQDHNAVDAIKSAWGVDVVVNDDKSITLNQGGSN